MKEEHLTEKETQEMINAEYRPINWGCLITPIIIIAMFGALVYSATQAYFYLRGLL